MPRSKIRRKTAYVPPSPRQRPAKVRERTSHPIYVGVMLALLLLALAWVVVYYLAGNNVPLMAELGNWNFIIGFALMVAGLLMTMRWR